MPQVTIKFVVCAHRTFWGYSIYTSAQNLLSHFTVLIFPLSKHVRRKLFHSDVTITESPNFSFIFCLPDLKQPFFSFFFFPQKAHLKNLFLPRTKDILGWLIEIVFLKKSWIGPLQNMLQSCRNLFVLLPVNHNTGKVNSFRSGSYKVSAMQTLACRCILKLLKSRKTMEISSSVWSLSCRTVTP